MVRQTIGLYAILAIAFSAAATAAENTQLRAVIAAPQRTPAFTARDAARHPYEELVFFGIAPAETVVEIWPEPGYWTEMLAPYLKDKGTYYAAVQPQKGADSGAPDKFKTRLAADPNDFGKVKLTVLGAGQFDIAPAGTADLVLTFRNLHNWMNGGYADQALAAFYKALKPGGILGIEEHRARPTKPQDPKAESGYVRQDYAIDLARRAGFELVASSEIDANPKDTTDWPKGVWTLPPTFELGAEDHDKYAAIGEADNFVLKFRKPAH